MPVWQPLEKGLLKLAEEIGASKVVQEVAATAWSKAAPEASKVIPEASKAFPEVASVASQGSKPLLAEDFVRNSVERGKVPAEIYNGFLSDMKGLQTRALSQSNDRMSRVGERG